MARKGRNKPTAETAADEQSATASMSGDPAAPASMPPQSPASASGPAAAAPQSPIGGQSPMQPPESSGSRPPAPIVINAQYMKDASLEVPNAPRVFALMQKTSPNIAVNIDVRAQPVQETAFEVALHVHAKCTIGETVAFIVEVLYAGLFTVNVPREGLEPTLLIECPRLLFPFARNIVADLTRDGGFPPLMLGPVDFAAMYQNQVQQRAASAPPSPPPSTPPA